MDTLFISPVLHNNTEERKICTSLVSRLALKISVR